MPLPTLPSKLVWERIRVEFNFSSELLLNETITAWEVTVAVQTGDDPSPDDMLTTRRFLLGPVASQWIIQGLPGVVYRLIGTAVGSTGKTYKLEKTLAVLPCEQAIPPLFGVAYTTPLYPVDVLDELLVYNQIINGYEWVPPLDAMDVSILIVDGLLREPLASYSIPVEQLDVGNVILSGDLRAPLVSYNWPVEQLNPQVVVLSGNIRVALIQYTNWPVEQLNVQVLITGGSLT
jgi:hypothetical protein